MGRMIDIDSLKGCAIIRPTSHETTEHIKQCGDDCINHDDIPTAYNNSWIPCSERLPEAYDIASKPILERPWYLIQTEQGDYAVANYEILFGKNKWIGNAFAYNNVIAWKPIEPYQKEGE